MAIRTTANAVQDLLGDDYKSGRSLAVFVTTASKIVDRVVTCLSNKSLSLDSTEAELMERWLAAHAYTRSDPTYASESTLGASGSKHGQTGLNLDGSFYGQQAKALDPSGTCLVSISNGQKAGAAWLGRAPSDQTDYADRD